MTKQTRSAGRTDPLIGRLVGDYRLDALMATGGMARIYRGEDTRLGRPAAIKVLAHDDSNEDDTLTKRFQREARELAKLEHPNIITIYQYGELEGLYFLAMKLIKGRDLAQEFKRLKGDGQAMEVKRVLRILMQVASALDYAHANGVIHRDVKPSNILLTDDDTDTAILTDFGLVMQSSTQTTLGTAFGTPRYIAPEQATASHKAMAQSDIYSLAVVLYELLTGEPPFSGDSPMEIALSHISDPPPPPRSKNPKIPVAVEQEILKALEKEPEKRHRSAVEFMTTIQNGYGIDTLDLPPISTIMTRPQDAPTKSVFGNKAAKQQPKTAGKSGRRTLLFGVILVLIIIGIAGFAVFSNQNTPIVGVPVTLFYSDSTFTFYNASDDDLNVQKAEFVRGIQGTNDDYSGDRVPGDHVESKKCFRIILQGDQSKAPPECGTGTSKREQLSNQLRFFWRQETEDGTVTKSFEVRYNGAIIARCNTVARGGNDECRFTWPMPK